METQYNLALDLREMKHADIDRERGLPNNVQVH